jgi:hypothetical protein
MIAHMRAYGSITTADKAKAEAYYTSKGQAPASVIPPKSTAASFTEVLSANPQDPASKRRKAATSIGEHAAFSNRFRHDKNEHARLIAELVSMNKVLLNVLSSPKFRRLKDVYLASAERTPNSVRRYCVYSLPLLSSPLCICLLGIQPKDPRAQTRGPPGSEESGS